MAGLVIADFRVPKATSLERIVPGTNPGPQLRGVDFVREFSLI